jgi:uncharacterized membrane protein YqaE (UPF0057 family)
MKKILLVIATILLPPLGVALKIGISTHFWINLILTLLGYIPGIIHGLWVVALDGVR